MSDGPPADYGATQRAYIMRGPHIPVLVWGTPMLLWDMRNAGIGADDAWNDIPDETGLWVWEGTIRDIPNEWGIVDDMEYAGTWQAATDEAWLELRELLKKGNEDA